MNFFQPRLISLFNVFLCLATTSLGSMNTTRLPPDEVEALKQIGRSLGKTDWDFNEDPCSGQSGWFNPPEEESEAANYVTCDCNFNSSTVCHILTIALKGQNLRGKLPPELVKLPYLQDIDLTRNYLDGTIPPEWGSMQLVNISLLGNRLNGSIPKELGNISTLANLTVEHNQLSGVIPPELGNLPRLEKLFLNSNNFTGELPPTLEKLTSMKDFRIGDNNFTGKIPNFIEGWTNLVKLVIQGSGLEGPIPSGIARLTNLTDVRITDLNGPESTFPHFRNMKHLKNLILRSCNIIGVLPNFSLGTTDLKILDLSFNKLSGEIPSSFFELRDTDYIYLTGNLLSGDVPKWMLEEGKKIDLSYNNLTLGSSKGMTCQQRETNLFGSSSKNYASGIASCLSLDCQENRSSLYINCGGPQRSVGNQSYERNDDPGGASLFKRNEPNWAVSSTGHFLDDGRPVDSYTVTNTSRLSMNNSVLYMDARVSPLSLTYYIFCLLDRNYTVGLHFAEIIFTDDKTYSSLGRRIFDIYIQGKLVWKDFNIADAAGGVGKEFVKNYTVNVTNKTLEIRFYWAGKGTTVIPFRGVYGPLISAISVDSGDPVPQENGPPAKNTNNISAGTVAGIAVGVAFAIFLVLGILWWRGCLQHKAPMQLDLKGLKLNADSFTLRQIKAATNNFDAANIIGEGGFGAVYKGVLSDGTIIAVKQLSSKSKQGNREFLNEIGMISALQHPHLVKLHGCCIEGNQLLLVYEYMENNSLARALFGPEECRLELDWPTRYRICIGIARGLAYLHEESRLKVVHRDIKATNVLLDKNFNPKISDFGLAKLDEEENTHISTRIAGTYGYMAPEYALRGYLTDKADVYSYGIVLLEIVSGMANAIDRTKQNRFVLLDRALGAKEKGNLIELVDPRLGSEYNEEEVMVIINVALLCTKVTPTDRPLMSSVVSILEGRASSGEFVSGQSVSTNEIKRDELMKQLQIEDMSIVGPWTATSTSTADLYPITDYLEKRDNEMASKLLP